MLLRWSDGEVTMRSTSVGPTWVRITLQRHGRVPVERQQAPQIPSTLLYGLLNICDFIFYLENKFLNHRVYLYS